MKQFDSLAGFASHLVKTAALGGVVSHHIVKRAGEIIQHDAQSRIGSYQDGGGGFPAWANLAPATIEDRIRKGFTPEDPLLRTGEMRDSIEVEAHAHEAVVGTADVIALYQEQGTSTIPPRPFLGPAALHSKEKVGALSAAIAMAWIGGGKWRAKALTLPGRKP